MVQVFIIRQRRCPDSNLYTPFRYILREGVLACFIVNPSLPLGITHVQARSWVAPYIVPESLEECYISKAEESHMNMKVEGMGIWLKVWLKEDYTRLSVLL
jgi:hypothetical protein